MRKIWNVAIYARVSTDKKEQQESIPAQVQSLRKWLLDKSKSDSDVIYNLVETYEDAGFSGSNFDRESFIKMKEDIEKGKINMVLTRDLSRFSRNYVTAGYYLEDYFKVNRVRFISVLDNVDTDQEYNDIIPFKNILNEMYIRDCSRRVRDALKQRMIRGSSIASKPPYGYMFEEYYEGNVKTIKLIPSKDEATDVVKEIYSLYIKGWGFGKIATYLNKKGIEPPSARVKNFGRAKFGIWTNNSIHYILTNPKYAGMMVQQRWKKISYKVKKIVTTDEQDWIYGCDFEGIVTKEMFEEVQSLMKKRAKNHRYKGGVIHPFSTVIKCNECGGSVSYRKKFEGYKCTNSQMGGGRCTSHSVKEEFLKRTIIKDLKNYVNKYVNKEDEYNTARKIYNEQDDYEKELKNIEKDLKKLDMQFQQVYEDKLNEVINERNTDILITGIQKKQQILVERKDEVISIIAKISDKDSIYNAYRDKIDRILNFEEFERMTVETLIDKIIVSENKVTKEKKVEIFYKFRA
ncbi:recombinase family protein [Clostridium cibarium]|uniref:Recombinase family protein n=1 Tax=Clostridium cibarium TaxID=2762247 RepID=A0ABR8PXP7_9CLOT|nr:recombinase family protein [Clostridium cibarium]MBD7912931.1 recombinase family protein [Clostridium cibarium]